jgi:NTE family protein
VVLVLQGGGALGAYQGGVYEALHDAGVEPHWVIGTSIGAVNGALIAGNLPQHRVARLTDFWRRVEIEVPDSGSPDWLGLGHFWANLRTVSTGIPGFFAPNPAALLGTQVNVGVERASYYCTQALRTTLAELIDFESLTAQAPRLTVGAVNVQSGALHYFDTRATALGVEHIMASGALPPAFPAIRVAEGCYWDGGVYSNTPIEVVLNSNPRRDSLIFAVNVWHQSGPLPETIAQVLGRQKDIQYASRADSHIANEKQIHHLRHVIRKLYAEIPSARRDDPDVRALGAWGCSTTMHVAHLLAPRLAGEDETKDIDFTSTGVATRWHAGYADTERMLAAAPWDAPFDPLAGIIEHRL